MHLESLAITLSKRNNVGLLIITLPTCASSSSPVTSSVRRGLVTRLTWVTSFSDMSLSDSTSCDVTDDAGPCPEEGTVPEAHGLHILNMEMQMYVNCCGTDRIGDRIHNGLVSI